MVNSVYSNSKEGIELIEKWKKTVKKRDFYLEYVLCPQIRLLSSIPDDEIQVHYEKIYTPYHNAFQEINKELEEAMKNLPFDFNPNL